MWRCPKCQTMNSGKSCTLCGETRNTEDTLVHISGETVDQEVSEPTRIIHSGSLIGAASDQSMTDDESDNGPTRFERPKRRSGSAGKWLIPIAISAFFVAAIVLLSIFVIAPIFKGEGPITGNTTTTASSSSNAASAISEEITDIDSKIKAMEMQYTGSSDNVREAQLEELLGKVEEYAASLLAKNSIAHWEKGMDCVYIRANDGTGYVYMPPLYGYDSSIAAVHPSGKPEHDSYHAALLLADALEDMSFDSTGNFEGAQASVDALKELGKHKVIIWHGHGGYSAATGSFLLSGTSLVDNNKYDEDLRQGRLLITSQGYYAVTPEFFRHYLSSLPSTVVYLGACFSGYDDSLAGVFIDKGASAVAGASGRILTEYDGAVLDSFFEGLYTPSNTGEVRSVSDALEYAFLKNGSSDRGGATIRIFGNADKTLLPQSSVELPDEMKISDTELELLLKSTHQLSVAFTSKEGYEPDLAWESSDPSVATVKDGLVTAAGLGEAVITAKTDYGLKVSCRINVVLDHIKPDLLEISLDKDVMIIGTTQEVNFYISPSNAYTAELIWYTSNERVVTVENRTVKAVSPGEAIIYAKIGDMIAECPVKVITSGPESIKLNASSLQLTKGDYAILTATVKPEEYASAEVRWTSSDEEVATVEDGLITAHNTGTAVITAAASNGIKAECTITVTAGSASGEYTEGTSKGQLMPDLIMRTESSRAIFLSAFEGRKTVIVFADPESYDFEELMSELNDIYDNARGTLNIVVAFRDDRHVSISEIKNDLDIEFDLLLISSDLLSSHSINDIPTAFVLDRNRVIKDKLTGDIAGSLQSSLNK